ncbi:MAG: FtsQ-type POTRA domain-containing protein [Lawsonibacter sp.]|nr:FtsQ-type POTRA domain-containing protein [Lawsonibacter sp.]
MASSRNRRRRRRSRGRFSFLFKLLTLAAAAAALTLGATVFFQLERVEVEGNSRYTAQEIEAASGLRPGDNLFRLNKNQINAEIRQALPYIENLSIVRRWPSTILIVVKEWEAVARVEPMSVPEPAPEGGGEEQPEEGGARDSRTAESWLISVKGRLLEPAGENDSAIRVLGLGILSPRAGTAMAVSQEQQGRLNALLQLLAALEEQGQTGLVSEIDLTAASQVRMFYDNRFWVRLPQGGDYAYQLRALAAVMPDWVDYDSGTFDLTREDFPITFSPD